MVYLTLDDFKAVTLETTLTKFLDVNPGALENAVDVALDEAASYISGRYDLTQAYVATGTGRNKMLVSALVDIALYHVYSGFSPRDVPNVRGLRYQAATDLFKGVSKGTRFLDLPLISTPEADTGYFLFGSNPKFNAE